MNPWNLHSVKCDRRRGACVWEGCGGGEGGMPATWPCEGGHGQGGEEVGRRGRGEEDTLWETGEDCEGEGDHVDVEKKEGRQSPPIFFTNSPSPFLPPASGNCIRWKQF